MIKKIVVFLLILLLLLLAGILFMLYTQPGARLAFSLVEKFVPELSVGQVNGRLTKLTLQETAYQMPGVNVTVGEAKLAISGSCLLKGEVCIRQLALNHSHIEIDTQKLPPSAPKEESKEPLQIQAPLPIVLQNVSIEDAKLNVDGTQVELGQFTTHATWVKRRLTIYPTEIQQLKVTLPDTQDTSDKTVKVDEATSISTRQMTLGEQLNELFKAPLIQSLPQVTLPLEIEIKKLQGDDIVIHQNRDYVIDELLLKAKATDKKVQIETISVKGPEGQLQLSGDAKLQDQWPVNLQAEGSVVLPEGKESVTLSLSGAVMDKLTLSAKASGLVNAELTAEAALATQNLPMQLTLKSQQLQWPLTGEPQFAARDVNVKLEGDVKKYHLIVIGGVKGQAIPPFDVKLVGQGGLTEFDLSQLLVKAFDGDINASGRVTWPDKVTWDAALQANHINTVSQLPDFPMVIDGDVKTQGWWAGEQWDVTVSQLNLKGNVKKRPLTVSGRAAGNAKGHWTFDHLDAQWGANQIKINGQINDRLQADAQLALKELGLVSPDLKGQIVGEAQVRGTLDKPQANLNLTANQLKFQTWQIEQANIKGDIQSAKEIGGKVSVDVNRVKGEGVDLKNIRLNLNGSESAHQLTLRLQGKPVNGQLALSGQFDRQKMHWRGQLRDTALDTPFDKWQLSPSATLDYAVNEAKLTVGEHCWDSRGAQICLPKPAEVGQSGQAQLQIKKLDLRKISQFLGDGLALRGILTGQVEAKWQPNSLPEVHGVINGKTLTVLQGTGIEPFPIYLDQIALKADIQNNVIAADLLAQLKDNGKISSQIRITDPANRKGLSGDITIDRITLAILKPLLQKHETANGVLQGKLTLGGQLTDPLINGNVNLNQVKISAGLLPLEVKNAEMALKFMGKASTLNGSIQSGNGALNLTGSANWRVLENWQAELKAKGDEIQVNVPPMVELKFTPDIEMTANAKAINLKGSVVIPWARIEVESLPESAVDISGDEVLLNANLTPVNPVDDNAMPIEVNSNLAIKIGDDVELSAYGLVAKLKGILLVKQNRKGLGLHGEVTIPEGRFHAYGQDLLIDKGELIFSGPVEQPMLNINAIRNPESIENGVKAGVKVTGLADEPKIEIYSEPAMSQQEALSYLLRGQGLSNEAGGNDNDMMTAILIGLGASQGGKYIGKVGEMFGIRDLSLDTQGVGDGSQVVVSGYILPNLQLKYGIGIFDSLATFTLRYRLLPKLYLEAVSSLDQAVDLIYQFEF